MDKDFILYHLLQKGVETTISKVPLKDWTGIQTFYVINSDIRPIPQGMVIFCMRKTGNIITYFRARYSPYDIEKDCETLMCYGKPVINSIPLYFYKPTYTSTINYPSFSYDASKIQKRISPIGVFVNPTFKFHCIVGRCIPWVTTSSLKEVGEEGALLTIRECAGKCVEKPKNILELVDMLNHTTKNYSWLIILSFIILGVIVFLFLKLKK